MFIEMSRCRLNGVTLMPHTLTTVAFERAGTRRRVMTLHIETAQRSRLATYNKNTCPQCSGWLLAPDWSEHLSERCVRHAWSCEACGYEFETAVFFSTPAAAAA
jgi:uncharacterized protein with PIN domain